MWIPLSKQHVVVKSTYDYLKVTMNSLPHRRRKWLDLESFLFCYIFLFQKILRRILTNVNYQQVIKVTRGSLVVKDCLVYLVLLIKLKGNLECLVFLVALEVPVIQDLKALLVSWVSLAQPVPG